MEVMKFTGEQRWRGSRSGVLYPHGKVDRKACAVRNLRNFASLTRRRGRLLGSNATHPRVDCVSICYA